MIDFNIDALNAHPWDKISHALIGLIIAAPFYLVGWLLDDPVWSIALAMTGSAAALGVFYGREQDQHWHKHRDKVVASWFAWNWSRDAIWDWLVVWPPQLILLLLIWWQVGTVGHG